MYLQNRVLHSFEQYKELHLKVKACYDVVYAAQCIYMYVTDILWFALIIQIQVQGEELSRLKVRGM